MAYAWAGQIQTVEAEDNGGDTHVFFDDSAPVEGLIPGGTSFSFTAGQVVTLLGELSVRESDGRVILTTGYAALNP